MATEVDFTIEGTLATFLQHKTPGIGFLGEEGVYHNESRGLMWALDPVDGTVNFVHGSPLCGISLGLLQRGVPVLGVIDLPFLGLRYTASKGHGAFRGQDRIHTSSTIDMIEAVVAIGDYAVGADAAGKNSIRLATTGRLAGTAQRIRMHGSAAVDLAWLADGRVDGVVIMSNKPWDTAAGVIIAQEAGANVVDRDGSPHTSDATATIAANPNLLPALLQAVSGAPA